jgi:hypothetical protein
LRAGVTKEVKTLKSWVLKEHTANLIQQERIIAQMASVTVGTKREEGVAVAPWKYMK